MEIRQAILNELEQIINIERICFPPAEAADEESIRERFEVFGDCFIVAMEGDKVAGFVNGCVTDSPDLPDELYHNTSLHKPEGDYQTVFGLDVLPEFQRRKIATALMAEFTKRAKEKGKKGVVLTCKDHLIPFYMSCGFKHCGVSQSCHGGSKWNDMLLIFD